jgi:hypothetical protein
VTRRLTASLRLVRVSASTRNVAPTGATTRKLNRPVRDVRATPRCVTQLGRARLRPRVVVSACTRMRTPRRAGRTRPLTAAMPALPTRAETEPKVRAEARAEGASRAPAVIAINAQVTVRGRRDRRP